MWQAGLSRVRTEEAEAELAVGDVAGATQAFQSVPACGIPRQDAVHQGLGRGSADKPLDLAEEDQRVGNSSGILDAATSTPWATSKTSSVPNLGKSPKRLVNNDGPRSSPARVVTGHQFRTSPGCGS